MNKASTTFIQPGRVIYLLILVTIVQSIYPITRPLPNDQDLPLMLILYQLLYASLMVAGILVARESATTVRLLVVLGVAWFVVGSIYAFNQTAVWALLTGYGVIGLFQGALVVILLRFVFTARTVTRDVLYAACSVYLLLGAIFIPIYGTVETLTFFGTGGLDGGIHAFDDGGTAVGEIIPWQTFVYYSYATLTTLGYGDILPVTMWARSLASLEAIIGVLYITVIMARLVGLYASGEVEKEMEEEMRLFREEHKGTQN